MAKINAPKTERFEVRLSENDAILLTWISKSMGMTKSRYFKMLLDSSLAPIRSKLARGELKFEDLKADINYKL